MGIELHEHLGTFAVQDQRVLGRVLGFQLAEISKQSALRRVKDKLVVSMLSRHDNQQILCVAIRRGDFLAAQGYRLEEVAMKGAEEVDLSSEGWFVAVKLFLIVIW